MTSSPTMSPYQKVDIVRPFLGMARAANALGAHAIHQTI
jgi:hypothetical protein